jgi:Domain of unknown function (DUF4263)
MPSDAFPITYEMSPDAPASMGTDEYVDRVSRAWAELLRSDPDEPAVQAFLQNHPLLVPGAHLGLGRLRETGHGPFPSALITQPPLRGLTARIPDFLWIASDSVFLNPVFLEIEAPGKRWVTAAGHQHHSLTQALHQLGEWRDWLDQPVNRELFLASYDVPSMLRQRKWEPVFVLIYGRRSEDPDAISTLRAHLTTKTRHVIPYEHLEPDPESADYLCARRGPNGYEAVTVPPTMQLGPRHAENWTLISGKERAVAASPWLSDERRAFLIERMPYWDAWGRHGRGIRRLSDVE